MQLNIGIIRYAAKDFRSMAYQHRNPKCTEVTHCPQLNHCSFVELKATTMTQRNNKPKLTQKHTNTEHIHTWATKKT